MIAPQTERSVVHETADADETRALGSALAAVARRGDRIALIGDLGAGKTQFAKGFAAGLGVRDVVNSPSFTLMAEYAGRLPLFHQDLYRLAGAEEALGGGLLDERQAEGVTLTEWAERLDELEGDALAVRISTLPGERRRIVIEGASADHDRFLDAARRAGAGSPEAA